MHVPVDTICPPLLREWFCDSQSCQMNDNLLFESMRHRKKGSCFHTFLQKFKRSFFLLENRDGKVDRCYPFLFIDRKK